MSLSRKIVTQKQCSILNGIAECVEKRTSLVQPSSLERCNGSGVVCLDGKWALQTHIFEHLVPSWWHCLEMLRRCVLDKGSELLEMVFEWTKTWLSLWFCRDIWGLVEELHTENESNSETLISARNHFWKPCLDYCWSLLSLPSFYVSPISPGTSLPLYPCLHSDCSSPWRENVILWKHFPILFNNSLRSFWNNPFVSAAVVYKICHKHSNPHSTPFLCVYFFLIVKVFDDLLLRDVAS